VEGCAFTETEHYREDNHAMGGFQTEAAIPSAPRAQSVLPFVWIFFTGPREGWQPDTERSCSASTADLLTWIQSNVEIVGT
jgi:hypothetical protein